MCLGIEAILIGEVGQVCLGPGEIRIVERKNKEGFAGPGGQDPEQKGGKEQQGGCQ